MAGVELAGQWAELRRTMENLELTDQDLLELNQRLAAILEQSTQERFEEEKDPDGRSWQRLSEQTLIARARRRTRRSDGTSGFKTKRGKVSKRAQRIMANAAILKDTSRLMRSIASKARPEGIAVGTNLVYGAIHQLGGKAGRGKSVEIPARPFLGVSGADEEDLLAMLQEFVEERIER